MHARRLGNSPVFPTPDAAHPSGLIAYGGRLDVDWLLSAYRQGIFPWYDEPPILWWTPDPRLILIPNEIKVSKSLRATVRKQRFEVRSDIAFREVIDACGTIARPGQGGTWIRPEIVDAYEALHEAGYAHSIETWSNGALVGGLYGVCLGGAFFGESMFSRTSDASKVALAAFAQTCPEMGIELIDCQLRTKHLVSMGAREISRQEFLMRLRTLVDQPRPEGSWTSMPWSRALTTIARSKR